MQSVGRKPVRQHILMIAHWTPETNVTLTYSAPYLNTPHLSKCDHRYSGNSVPWIWLMGIKGNFPSWISHRSISFQKARGLFSPPPYRDHGMMVNDKPVGMYIINSPPPTHHALSLLTHDGSFASPSMETNFTAGDSDVDLKRTITLTWKITLGFDNWPSADVCRDLWRLTTA